MKNFLPLLMFLCCLTGNSQNYQDEAKYIAVYELIHQPDSTNNNFKKVEKLRLYIGNKYSLFSSEGTVIKDSIMSNRDRSNKSMAAFQRLHNQVPKTDFEYEIYKNLPAEKLTYAEKIVKDAYRYTENKQLMEWVILPDTNTISGYRSQKASTSFRGRNYTAWFTSEIPISEGPYKFSGLPGLIIQISDEKEHYQFSLLEFKILKSPRAINFDADQYQKIKREDFLAVVKNYNRDPFAALKNNGITIGFEAGQKEKMLKEHQREMKKVNNPLELKKE